ncbi:GNAT family N-acetyltransferase [Elstera cyanobacteriorum]|uniref:L-ornithine N(alpha)-acyltransferase n=1 Tax=Elstera cyanobacteriorum TaxID=2022747 RepID=A0A255XLI6_9PROT|nr:GNAT family N-acyltransferase [Elstera cyanobacteriorum]MCK6443106.1 GNAT family N-acetyltransferase [Elstera cyanobacteriorum]OYQ17305.1 hemolysin-like protein [Elstera cyanobacteriorum]GFZ92920.1 ornithine-acyl ACP N-acyltransferase [Elstera cyanobacteriorum]
MGQGVAPVTPKLAGDLKTGSLEVRLAETAAELDAAQALRYRIFYEEMQAKPDATTEAARRDVDAYDAQCDHLLVLDHSLGEGADAVVGTYRLIRKPAADAVGGFYTRDEFNIAPLLALKGNLLELGRSCVDTRYRTRPTMQLLWRGIASYVFHYDIALMFGCASLPGVDPDAHKLALSYLHHYHLAPEEMRPRALPDRFVALDRMPKDAIDMKRALADLPPLIKGYLRLGGFIGDGAVIDHQFNTVDVCILVKTDLVTDKYFNHYSRTTGGPSVGDGDEPAGVA